MLVVEGLVKRFGGFTAVNNVSFKVDQGEILGLIGPNGSGKSTIFNMLSGTFPPIGGIDHLRGPRDRRPAAAPHHQPRHRPHLPDPAAVPPALDLRECGAGRLLRPGRRSSHAAKAYEAAEHALAMVGLPTDRAGQRRRAGRRRAEEARARQGAGHRAQAAARRREPGRPRRDRDGPGGRHAAQDPRRARHHHHLGRAHHGRADARGRSRHGARSRREDLRGPAERGVERSAGDRGLSRHRRRTPPRPRRPRSVR